MGNFFLYPFTPSHLAIDFKEMAFGFNLTLSLEIGGTEVSLPIDFNIFKAFTFIFLKKLFPSCLAYLANTLK